MRPCAAAPPTKKRKARLEHVQQGGGADDEEESLPDEPLDVQQCLQALQATRELDVNLHGAAAGPLRWRTGMQAAAAAPARVPPPACLRHLCVARAVCARSPSMASASTPHTPGAGAGGCCAPCTERTLLALAAAPTPSLQATTPASPPPRAPRPAGLKLLLAALRGRHALPSLLALAAASPQLTALTAIWDAQLSLRR